MIINQTNVLNVLSHHLVFKSSDNSGGILLARYLVNVLKKGKHLLLEQFYVIHRRKIIRYYEGITRKNTHTDEPHRLSKIKNKKQSP
jgi:hypothetical protein